MKKKKKLVKAPIVGVGFIMVDIQNPNFNPAHEGSAGNPALIQAIMNPRESPIAWYYCQRSRTKVEEYHVRAANEFRRLYERSGGSGMKAFDYTKDPVDGGNVSDGITEGRMDAAKKLKDAHQQVGYAGFSLLQATCGELLWIKDQYATRRLQDSAMDDLKKGLDVLAEYWGYKSRSRHYNAA